jgi:hypothetical protein
VMKGTSRSPTSRTSSTSRSGAMPPTAPMKRLLVERRRPGGPIHRRGSQPTVLPTGPCSGLGMRALAARVQRRSMPLGGCKSRRELANEETWRTKILPRPWTGHTARATAARASSSCRSSRRRREVARGQPRTAALLAGGRLPGLRVRGERSGNPRSVLVFWKVNIGGVYQGSTQLSFRVTVSHLESRGFGVPIGLR